MSETLKSNEKSSRINIFKEINLFSKQKSEETTEMLKKTRSYEKHHDGPSKLNGFESTRFETMDTPQNGDFIEI